MHAIKQLNKNKNKNDLEGYVINTILDYVDLDDEVKEYNDLEEREELIEEERLEELKELINEGVGRFFIDLWQCGCEGGFISELIYSNDAEAFFDKYQEDIEELKEEYENMTGEAMRIKGNIKNWLAWFGFEAMAKQIEDNLNI